MSATTNRVYNTTDGPLLITDEGHVLGSRESARVKSIDEEPIAGHLEAGRLIDTTEAKAEGDELDQAAKDAAEAAKTKAAKATNSTPRS